MGNVEAEEARSRLTRVGGLAAKIGRTNASDRIDMLKRLIARVTVQADRIDVAVRPGALWSQDYVPVADEPVTMIDVPVQLKRCGMAVRLIVRAPP